MSHATAAELKTRLRSSIRGLDMSKLMQIAMDGPNVNWKLHEDFQHVMKQECNVKLVK